MSMTFSTVCVSVLMTLESIVTRCVEVVLKTALVNLLVDLVVLRIKYPLSIILINRSLTSYSVEVSKVSSCVLHLNSCGVNVEVKLVEVGSDNAELTIRTLQNDIVRSRVGDCEVLVTEVSIRALVVEAVVNQLDVGQRVTNLVANTEVLLNIDCRTC